MCHRYVLIPEHRCRDMHCWDICCHPSTTERNGILFMELNTMTGMSFFPRNNGLVTQDNPQTMLRKCFIIVY